MWLDIVCLRQQSDTALLETIRQDEWKIDVPTIGNVYRVAGRIVRYFNGLGIPFRKDGWDSHRHWLQRAWTLQEISTEDMTFNEGMLPDNKGILLNTVGKVGGKAITLRRAMLPLLDLIAELHSRGGCSMYQLTREMAKRVAATPTDKVAGLFYLLRPAELSTYNAMTSAEATWRKFFHVLPFGQKLEILFNFPYRGTQEELFPSWEQIMAWPERNPEYQHSPTTSLVEHSLHSRDPIPRGIEDKRGLYLSNVVAILHVVLQAWTVCRVNMKPRSRIGHSGFILLTCLKK